MTSGRPRITVLYEDRQLGREFALHQLVVQMVVDDSGVLHHEVAQAVSGTPRGGVDKVLSDLKMSALLNSSSDLLLLVDRDRIHEHLSRRRDRLGTRARDHVAALTATSADDDLVQAIRALCPRPEAVGAFFLQPNLEGLLHHLHVHDPAAFPAVETKDRATRDIALRAARRSEHRDARRMLREQQPGLAALVQRICELLDGAQ